jgi:SAM-dependent methyltransferase
MKQACSVCDQIALRVISAFADLPRVTSDCKPWPSGGEVAVCEICGTIQKPASAPWLGEIKQIYDAYELYHQSEGAEQPIFCADGSSAPRSRLLINYLAQHLTNSSSAGKRLIDIGCGTGAALKNFSEALPAWSFDGAELTDNALPNLRKIPRFERLYTVPVTDIDERYDVVTLIHSLEHIVDPPVTLGGARRLLKPDGTLLVQVPDIETSPFDLLVADHRTHFTRKTLGLLAARQGIGIDVLVNTVLPKEITLIGRPSGAASISPQPTEGLRIAAQTVKWLHDLLARAEGLSAVPNFGIFGSSISAMWLYGALRGRVKFFVDEDNGRIGRFVNGVPILAPANVPPKSTVFVPLTESAALPLVRRLSHIEAKFVLPTGKESS